jgi:[ribosomal protein S18]-alanine N-acetyltransferase
MDAKAVRITRLVPPDVPSLAALIATSEPWTRYGITLEAAGALWERALYEDAAVSVARRGVDAVGFTWYIPHAGFGLSGYLKLLGVAREARGQGIGAALLSHVEQQTLADGQNDLILLVSAFNQAAQRFYYRQGYREIGRLASYVAPGIDELIFRKRLHREVME